VLSERRSRSTSLAPTHHGEAKETAAEEGQGGGLRQIPIAEAIIGSGARCVGKGSRKAFVDGCPKWGDALDTIYVGKGSIADIRFKHHDGLSIEYGEHQEVAKRSIDATWFIDGDIAENDTGRERICQKPTWKILQSISPCPYEGEATR